MYTTGFRSQGFLTLLRSAFAICMSVVGLQTASALSIANLTSDATLKPVEIYGLGTENLQKITVEFSDPVNSFSALDTFSYIIVQKDDPAVYISISYASLTDIPSDPLFVDNTTSVNLWINGLDFPGNLLLLDTDYLFRVVSIIDADGIGYFDELPDFEFRISSASSVPDASTTFALLAPVVAGILAFRRRLK